MKRTRTNWTKKATILLAAICVALVGLSAFTPPGAQDWLLQVDGVPLSRAVYSYFLSRRCGTPGRTGSWKRTAGRRTWTRCAATWARAVWSTSP